MEYLFINVMELSSLVLDGVKGMMMDRQDMNPGRWRSAHILIHHRFLHLGCIWN